MTFVHGAECIWPARMGAARIRFASVVFADEVWSSTFPVVFAVAVFTGTVGDLRSRWYFLASDVRISVISPVAFAGVTTDGIAAVSVLAADVSPRTLVVIIAS